jgi:hypothetical protein
MATFRSFGLPSIAGILRHTTCLEFSVRSNGPSAGLVLVRVELQRLARDSVISWREEESLRFTWGYCLDEGAVFKMVESPEEVGNARRSEL